jgi:hypothetical protein
MALLSIVRPLSPDCGSFTTMHEERALYLLLLDLAAGAATRTVRSRLRHSVDIRVGCLVRAPTMAPTGLG